MGQLAEWAKKNSKAVILDDGESLEVIYCGFKIGANPFDPEKEIVMYRFEVEQHDGQKTIKVFKSTSNKVARFFDETPLGSTVRLFRHGLGPETTYDLQRLASPAQPPPTDDEDEELTL